MIEVRNLVKQYGDHIAVDNISFTIEPGRIYGFLGPNGAGKSTTMNMMTGYLAPTSGEIIINGHNIQEEPEEAKRCVGYLPELPPLYTDMTVKEFLTFAAQLKGVAKKNIQEEVDSAIKSTRLEEMVNRLTSNLSKGYKQRVGIAQALIGSPDIIILDEPTVGLDPKQIIEIRDLIRRLGGKHTVILSSHILSEVQAVCDHVIIVHRGKLLANGTQAELEQKLGTSTMDFTVKATNISQVENMLYHIPRIEAFSCNYSPSRDGEVTVNLKFDVGHDIRTDIFYACVKAGLPLVMMNVDGYSLERIFLELTNDSRGVYQKHRVKKVRKFSEAEEE